ncbi:hypothetical protein DQ384_27530 [Sphaerisporangium album]|uniref:YtkA-like domain-containing protein n=1 Tax=Sphaerisporangium album TaxID=509200 RepID=A0A367FBZ8_9ACTN|nr:hypothetical protein DQ384_27530 [Sphaerisporangium album]
MNIVHTERVQAGPYGVTIGFSVWPVHAMQSMDFSFIPDGGIQGKSGQLHVDGPNMPADERVQPLARHPRKRGVWGLDTTALPSPGQWRFGFVIDGPQGRGEGSLATPFTALQQPGPPLALSWSITTIPLLFLVGFIAVAWRRMRPGSAMEPLTA